MTKKIRHHQLLRYVNNYTSQLWAKRIINSLRLAGQKAKEYRRLQKLDTGYLQVHYISRGTHVSCNERSLCKKTFGTCEKVVYSMFMTFNFDVLIKAWQTLTFDILEQFENPK